MRDSSSLSRFLPVCALFLAAPGLSQCRLPELEPGALARMSPEELVETGHFQQAVTLLEPLARDSKNAPAACLLSRAKSHLGDLDEALKLAETAVSSDPENAAYHVQVAAVAGRMAQKASMLRQLGLARRVKKELDEAARLDPLNTDAQWGLMMYYYAAPSLLGGDKTKTEQIGREMVKRTPALGLYYLGRLAREIKDSGKKDAGTKDSAKGVDSKETNNQNEIDREESYYKQAFLANPLLYEPIEALLNFYLEESDYLDAGTWSCVAVHVDPSRGQGWAALARVLAADACWTEATAAAAKYEAFNPNDLAPYFGIALAAVERGEQLEMAEQFLRKYLSRPQEAGEPSAAMAHWQLGRALGMLGRRAAGASEIRAALQLDGSLEGAKADMKRLSSEARQ